MSENKLKKCYQYFWKVPFLVPYWNWKELFEILKSSLKGRLVEGKSIDLFVKEFCDLIGVKYGIVTNLGRSAIELILRAMEIKEGDEVILPSFCCKGILMPVLNAGCRPVMVDIDRNFNISVESCIKKITLKTKAIIVPHLSGKAAEIDKIKEAVKDRNIIIIDDACQATGGRKEGKYLGTLGDVGIFSFGMGKNMMACSGGMVVTDSEKIYQKMCGLPLEKQKLTDILKKLYYCFFRMFLRKYTFPFYLAFDRLVSLSGIKSSCDRGSYKMLKMSSLDAAILRIQLKKLEDIIARRRRNAEILYIELSDVEEILLPEWDEDHVFTKFIITLKKTKVSGTIGPSREVIELARFLTQKSVETEGTYIPLHLREGFEQYADEKLTVTEDLYLNSFTLPVQPKLSEKNMFYIGEVIKEYFEKNREYNARKR